MKLQSVVFAGSRFQSTTFTVGIRSVLSALKKSGRKQEMREGELRTTVPTSEDWYPTIDGKLKVSLLYLGGPTKRPERWRVCVWGGDDFGMERDFCLHSQALDIFSRIIKLDVTVNALTALGLVSA